MPQHVALVGADLFPAYYELARGLKQVGALVTGIGPTSHAGALPADLKPWLDAWEPVGSVTDAQSLLDGARRAARRCARRSASPASRSAAPSSAATNRA